MVTDIFFWCPDNIS